MVAVADPVEAVPAATGPLTGPRPTTPTRPSVLARGPVFVVVVLVALALVGTACTSGGTLDGSSAPPSMPAAPGGGGDDQRGGAGRGPGGDDDGTGRDDALPGVIVLATDAGALEAYDGSADPAATPVEARRLHPTDPTDSDPTDPADPTDPTDPTRPEGSEEPGASPAELSGQVCVVPDGSRRVVAATPDAADGPGWAVLQLTGQTMATLAAQLTDTFAPTYAPDAPARPHGCAFLPDGRLLTTDRGHDPATDGRSGSGQLLLWFPPFVDDADQPRACKVATDLHQPGQIWVDDQDRALVATTSGVWRFSGPWPTGPHPDQGCDGVDATGAPAQAQPRAELLVPAGTQGIGVPGSIAGGPDGDLFIASPAEETVTEHDVNGMLRRTVLGPSPDGAPPTAAAPGVNQVVPVGVAVGPDRAVFVLVEGLVVAQPPEPGAERAEPDTDRAEPDVAPGGAIVRIRLTGRAEPTFDVLTDRILAPSGLGLIVPTAAPGPASKA